MPTLRNLRIREVSFCRTGMNQHAVVAIYKSADSDPVEDFAKATFREALESSQMEARFSRAFYEAFDGIYTVNDAFREALKDRYNDREETAKQYVEAVAELARRAVEATTGLAKSDSPDTDIIKAAITAAIEEAGEDPMLIKNKTELAAAIAKFQKSGGTQAEIDAIKAAATTLNAEDILPADGALAKAGGDSAALAALQARLDKSDKIAALSGDVRKFYDTLPAADQDTFLAKSAADQAAQMQAAQGDDPVLYTQTDGTQILKSHGPLALSQAKAIDALMNRVAKAEATAGDADLRKRARDDLSKLAGTEDTHVAILKAIDGITDPAVRTAALESLRSANKAAGGAFVRVGTTAGGGAIEKSAGGGGLVSDELSGADAELDQMAKSAMPEHGNDYFKAYQAVIETPEGRALYRQTVDNAAAQ